MKDPRKARHDRYARLLADRMDLKDWRVEVGDDTPSAEDALATVSMAYGQRHCVIRLSEKYLDLPPEDQRKVMTHELVHCHLEAGYEIASEAIPEATEKAFRRMWEHGVDALAVVIARSMPLPDAIDTPTHRDNGIASRFIHAD